MYKKEGNYEEARKYFERGAKLHNQESMFKYAKMLIEGAGENVNIEEAMNYLNISMKHKYNKSTKYLSIYDKLKSKESFMKLSEKVQHFFVLKIFEHNKSRNDDDMNMNFEFQFSSSDTETFFTNEVIFNPDFIEMLKSFPKIIVFINYPTKSLGLKYIKNINVCIIILNSITSIGEFAFCECSSLTQITFKNPSSVTSIGYSAFRGCSLLTQITIHSSVTSIGNIAFCECSSLTQITFEVPSSVTSIGYSAFSGCSSLTQITIPSSVTSIGYRK